MPTTAGQQTYTAGQVAQALGIPAATLRSWHRRYGVAPRAERDGGYRRYAADDVMRLEHMRDLVRSGALASDAARMVMARHGAGVDVLLGRLVAASRALDGPGCQAITVRALHTFGAVVCWEQLCRPALHEVESGQNLEDPSVSCIPQEHVLSAAIAVALRHHTADVATRSGKRAVRVLLACADGEHHTLPMEALSAALAERGAAPTMLGASVPGHGVAEAARALSPQAIVVWAQRDETASRDWLAALRRRAPRVLTAGPGWSRTRASHLTTLDDAVLALTTDAPAPRAQRRRSTGG